MIELYFWTTPNGYKPLLFLEESDLEYRIEAVNISLGEQFEPDFLALSPNNRIPALVDHRPAEDGDTITLFESGAILLYLAEKTGRFLPSELAGRHEVMQWLFWQMGGLGPMLGQNLHFGLYAPDKLDYAITRYVDETARLFRVLDTRLADRDYLAGKYSIADMACYPWVLKAEALQQDIAEFPHLRRWFERIAARPATRRAYEIGVGINTVPTITEESKKFLLQPGGTSVAA
jgi:GST-like protein